MPQRILLVDDQKMLLKLQAGIIKNLGFEVDTAESCSSASNFICGNQYDVILMDMQMPDVDGLICTRTIRKKGLKTPIVALTGNDSPEDKQACIDAGMQGLITKPIQVKTFKQKLADILVS